MNKLWLRISSAFFFTSVILLTILLFVVSNTFQTFTKEQIISQLNETAHLIESNLETTNKYDDPSLMDDWFTSFSDDSNIRITFIDLEGNVAADSFYDSETMDNHGDREEVSEILNSGANSSLVERYSDTHEQQMIYYALKIQDSNGYDVGVLRTSMSLSILENLLYEHWRNALIIAIGLILIFAYLSAVIARSLSKPIQKIIGVTKELRNKNYSSRVDIKASGEIKELGESVNALAISLFQQTKEIEENERELESILSQMTNGVMLINQKGEIMLMNSSMEQILSVSKEKLSGLHYTSINNFPSLIRLINECLYNSTKIHEEIHLNDQYIYDAHLTPFFGKGWQKRGVIVVLHNITNIRRLEQVRSDFVANVSHELKTPVTSVKGFAETLLSGEVRDKETEQYFLKIIYDESERIDRLIHDLLQLTRIEKHEMPLNITSVDMIQLIHKTSETLQKEIENKGLTLHLPNPSEPIYVDIDIDRFSQVILNLIINAVNYSKEMGNISVGVVVTKEEFILAVSDDGIGIPKESISRVFERFYRVDKARSRHSGGTGLGLSIVKHLVELHKGKIDVESVEGEGSTFTVVIPRIHENDAF